ncbi:MAG: RNA pyrophosphohydrolase [Aquisalimonadaceae bacterium]
MIDPDGFRPNVGIILTNGEGRVFWARRIGQDAWQFPQGGIDENETPREALYRELAEEVGLEPQHVELVGSTTRWLRYHLPRHLIRRHHKPLCIGQKQLWFMLRLVGGEEFVRLDAGDKPEFDHWCWVDYWHPVREVVFFKRQVYRRALKELAPLAFPDGVPEPPGMPMRRRARGRGGNGPG